MKAIGMIEVYGYLSAVEALDSALKAANVHLFRVICAKGGLVTVLFIGDVGAVQASADAASASARQLGSVLSVHVIPRPAEEIGRMLAGPFRGGPSPRPPEPSESPETWESPEPGRNGQLNWRILSDEQLHQLTVSELRSIVRSLAASSMTRKEIRFGKKEELIAEIQKFCGQEG